MPNKWSSLFFPLITSILKAASEDEEDQSGPALSTGHQLCPGDRAASRFHRFGSDQFPRSAAPGWFLKRRRWGVCDPLWKSNQGFPSRGERNPAPMFFINFFSVTFFCLNSPAVSEGCLCRSGRKSFSEKWVRRTLSHSHGELHDVSHYSLFVQFCLLLHTHAHAHIYMDV